MPGALSSGELLALAKRFADDWGDFQVGLEHATVAVLDHLSHDGAPPPNTIRFIAAMAATREAAVGVARFGSRRPTGSTVLSADLRAALRELDQNPPTAPSDWLRWVHDRLTASADPRLRALAGSIDLTQLTSAIDVTGAVVTRQSGEPRKRPAAHSSVPFTMDLTELAAEGRLNPVFDREVELATVIRVLLRRTKNHPVLIGPAGIGKTSIVELLAMRIAAGRVPARLQEARVLELDLGALLAGTRYRGDLEERLALLLRSLQEQGNRVLLFLDEVHLLVGAGLSEGSPVDLGNLLKPQLARGTISLIGATTDLEYDDRIRSDPALERRLHPIPIAEPTLPQTVSIIDGLRPVIEEHHAITLPREIVRRAVLMSAAILPGRAQPDKAIDLVEDACARCASNLGASQTREAVDVADLVAVLPSLALAPGMAGESRRLTRPGSATELLREVAIRALAESALTASSVPQVLQVTSAEADVERLVSELDDALGDIAVVYPCLEALQKAGETHDVAQIVVIAGVPAQVDAIRDAESLQLAGRVPRLIVLVGEESADDPVAPPAVAFDVGGGAIGHEGLAMPEVVRKLLHLLDVNTYGVRLSPGSAQQLTAYLESQPPLTRTRAVRQAQKSISAAVASELPADGPVLIDLRRSPEGLIVSTRPAS